MTQFTSCISLPPSTCIYLHLPLHRKAILRCKPCPAIHPHFTSLPPQILPFHPLIPPALSFAARNCFFSSSFSSSFFSFTSLFLSNFLSFFSSIFLSIFLLLTIYHPACPSDCPLFLLFSNKTGQETWRFQLNFIYPHMCPSVRHSSLPPSWTEHIIFCF